MVLHFLTNAYRTGIISRLLGGYLPLEYVGDPASQQLSNAPLFLRK
jgi:hypothetical protein